MNNSLSDENNKNDDNIKIIEELNKTINEINKIIIEKEVEINLKTTNYESELQILMDKNLNLTQEIDNLRELIINLKFSNENAEIKNSELIKKITNLEKIKKNNENQINDINNKYNDLLQKYKKNNNETENLNLLNQNNINKINFLTNSISQLLKNIYFIQQSYSDLKNSIFIDINSLKNQFNSDIPKLIFNFFDCKNTKKLKEKQNNDKIIEKMKLNYDNSIKIFQEDSRKKISILTTKIKEQSDIINQIFIDLNERNKNIENLEFQISDLKKEKDNMRVFFEEKIGELEFTLQTTKNKV